MARYIQTPAYPGKMPVDISFVFSQEKPAGKHGFVKCDGENFVFEDGTPARFWGVNFNGGANFPEHDYAEKVARRLAQTGCNIVRFHQLDAEWDTPNIWAYTKGPRIANSRDLDPTSMDHLDYLIYALKQQGIYCYFDMMTYRKFRSGDDVPHADELKDSAKPYSMIDPRMIELQKEFCDKIWNRMNPYTGLLYKDDPVFVMAEITNECDLFNFLMKLPPYEECSYWQRRYREDFRDWLSENNLEFDWQNALMSEPEETIYRYKLDRTKAYYKEIYDHMKAIGVKFPITGTNWTHGVAGIGIINSGTDLDFYDGHGYYYDWSWGEFEKMSQNVQVNGHPAPRPDISYVHVINRPFFVSEWDMPWPNSYRAEGPIYFAALSCLQNWMGMAIHTYAYDTRKSEYDIIGKEVSSPTIGGVPYREGIFATWNDPCKFGLFYHSALMVRRGDVKPCVKKIGTTIPDHFNISYNARESGLEQHRIVTIPDGENATGCDEVISTHDTVPSFSGDPNIITSDTGEVWRNMAKQFAVIDTPRTKVIYGRMTEGRYGGKPCPLTRTDNMQVACENSFAVIALSSLTDAPTEDSDNLLLSTISRAMNSEAQFDGDKMVSYGHAPILSEVVTANISFRTNRTDLKVWGVNAEGYYTGQIPAKFEDGFMKFKVGPNFAANYYLIVAD